MPKRIMADDAPVDLGVDEAIAYMRGWNACLDAGAKNLPEEPSYAMLKAMAGYPVLLAASDEQELRRRYAAMREVLNPRTDATYAGPK